MNEFEKVIKAYLDEFAGKDAEFSNKYAEKATKLGGDDDSAMRNFYLSCRQMVRLRLNMSKGWAICLAW